MFNLLKDLDVYAGIPPYASEHYGVYQPLLGWQSRLTKKWLTKGGIAIDPRVKRILDGRLIPGPTQVMNPDPREFIALPLQPASGGPAFRVALARDLNSDLLALTRAKVEAFVNAHAGRLPDGPDWGQIVDINNLMDAERGDLRLANNAIRDRIYRDLVSRAAGQPISEAMLTLARNEHLEAMKFESQIATFLLTYAEGQDGLSPNELGKLFQVREAAPLSDLFRPTDPLSNIDPERPQRSAIARRLCPPLSPVLLRPWHLSWRARRTCVAGARHDP